MEMDFIGLPRPLVMKVNELAAKEGMTPEELVRDAVEARLRRADWVKSLDFGDLNAHERDLKSEDVGAEIAATRSKAAH